MLLILELMVFADCTGHIQMNVLVVISMETSFLLAGMRSLYRAKWTLQWTTLEADLV